MATHVIHVEVVGKDGPKLQKFYADAFGWGLDTTTRRLRDVPGRERLTAASGRAHGRRRARDVLRPHRRPKGTLARVEKLGGKVIMPLTQVAPETTIALFADPEGHIVGLMCHCFRSRATAPGSSPGGRTCNAGLRRRTNVQRGLRPSRRLAPAGRRPRRGSWQPLGPPSNNWPGHSYGRAARRRTGAGRPLDARRKAPAPASTLGSHRGPCGAERASSRTGRAVPVTARFLGTRTRLDHRISRPPPYSGPGSGLEEPDAAQGPGRGRCLDPASDLVVPCRNAARRQPGAGSLASGSCCPPA